jgi:hypothetical protein
MCVIILLFFISSHTINVLHVNHIFTQEGHKNLVGYIRPDVVQLVQHRSHTLKQTTNLWT